MDLSTHLKQVNIGEPAYAAGLKVFPLYPRAARTLELSLLSDAVARRDAVILEDETPGGGAWFRRVAIENRGSKTILVRDGDMLLGGKQDRTAERSCLVAANSRVVIPALCVEQGRSDYAGEREFTVSRTSADPELRRARHVAVFEQSELQSLTWDHVGDRRVLSGFADQSGSLRDVDGPSAKRLAEAEEKLPAVYLATGLVMAWQTPNKTLALHLELFGDPSLCEQAWPGLVRGAAQCAKGRPPRVSRTEIRGLIDELASATVAREADQSLGELVRLRFSRGTASVLFAGAELAHASLFAA